MVSSMYHKSRLSPSGKNYDSERKRREVGTLNHGYHYFGVWRPTKFVDRRNAFTGEEEEKEQEEEEEEQEEENQEEELVET